MHGLQRYRSRWSHLAGLALVAPVGACGASEHAQSAAPAATVLVSAATSLSEAIGDVADAYERESGTRVLLNVAGSHLLATQIIEGAPVDLFVSADIAQMDRVAAVGRVRADQRVDLLSNQIVIVVPSDRSASISSVVDLDTAAIRRIALGDPDAVPAGIYARRYLESVGLWESLRHKVVPTRDVRAALTAVESGIVDAGVVYRTDAATSSEVVVAAVVPRDTGPAIVYPAAVATDAPNQIDAARFFDYLQGAEAGRLFAAAGFLPLSPASQSPERSAAGIQPRASSVQPRARR